VRKLAAVPGPAPVAVLVRQPVAGRLEHDMGQLLPSKVLAFQQLSGAVPRGQ
jgi:hypothetical protein